MAKEKSFKVKTLDVARYSKLLDMNSAYLGVSRLVLMENAGREVAAACSRFSDISIFCGTGNNGGDGFAAARHLSSMGKKVTVYAVAGVRSKDAEMNHSIVRKLDSIRLIYISDSKDCDKIKDDLQKADAVVDALLGVGVKGEVREPIKTLVKTINALKAYKVSADVPTPGLKPDITLWWCIEWTRYNSSK